MNHSLQVATSDLLAHSLQGRCLSKVVNRLAAVCMKECTQGTHLRQLNKSTPKRMHLKRDALLSDTCKCLISEATLGGCFEGWWPVIALQARICSDRSSLTNAWKGEPFFASQHFFSLN